MSYLKALEALKALYTARKFIKKQRKAKELQDWLANYELIAQKEHAKRLQMIRKEILPECINDTEND